MRRIARIQQQPSAVLTKCLHSQPTHRVRPMATVAATSCLASRPRAFSTTPTRLVHQFRPRKVDEAEKFDAIPLEMATEPENAMVSDEEWPESEETQTSIETDLVLPPTETTRAPRPDQLDSEGYVGATSAVGLPVVGGLKGWFAEDNAKDNWGPSKTFAGFASESRVTDSAQLDLCVRRAVLEALAMRTTDIKKSLRQSWRADGGWEKVFSLRVTVDGDGKATVDGDVKAVVKGLRGDVGARAEMMPADQAKEIVRMTDADWKRISLKDAKLKFVVAKRVFQLTGHAIPDAKLLNIQTTGGLLATLVKPEPARKLYEAVERRGELSKLPNVSVYPTRRTPVDVAKDLGRWKIVEQELRKQGLPVLGPDSVDKFRETEWYHGPQPDKKDKKKSRRKH